LNGRERENVLNTFRNRSGKDEGRERMKKKREFEGNKNITQVDKMNTGQEEGKFIDLTCVCVCVYIRNALRVGRIC
jgi:hypothetical protein